MILCLLALGLTALMLINNLWLVYRVLKPLQRLSSQTDALAQGNLHALDENCGGIAEIRHLQHSMASMAGHLRRGSEESTAYRHAMSEGQESERARIAHELHDETIQSLVAIAQGIDLASGWIAKDPQRAIEMLKLGRRQTVETVDALRRLIADLRPPALEELGLIPALQMLIEGESELDVSVQVSGIERRLPEAYELTFFRAAQEAFQNARRHAQAKQIRLQVDYRADKIQLTVSDDGIGFVAADCADCMVQQGHFGLAGIHERVQHLRGSVEISSQPGQGTKVLVSLPLSIGTQPSETVRDPVCGALISPQKAYGSVEHEAQTYYFCCPVCQGAFQRHPTAYLGLQL